MTSRFFISYNICMSEINPLPNSTIQNLTKETAIEYAEQLAELANLIPQVNYSPADLLAEHKGDRILSAKWLHSLVQFNDNQPIAFVMGYERSAEANPQYPCNTLYLSELAVARRYQGQGVAKFLLQNFFKKNNELGFSELAGDLNYSVQTNSADWNQSVVKLYESFGFKRRAFKEYPDRTDVVMGVSTPDLDL